MYFDSVQALLAMEGHGPFVWAAYALTTAVVAAMVLVPLRRRRRLLRELGAAERIAAAQARAEGQA
jgi:heme exporter protein D